MTDFKHQPQPEQLAFGDGPAPADPRRSVRRTAVVVGGGLAVLALGAGVLSVSGIATAASSPSPSESASASASTPGGREGAPYGRGGRRDGQPDGRHGHGRRDALGALGALGHLKTGMFGGVLHGQAVVRAADGTFSTVHGQTGTVTAVSATSITVRSDDGFSKTYVVTPDTRVNAARDGLDSIKVEATVGLVATEKSGTVTAERIVDRSRLESKWPGRPGATPSPSSS